MIRRQIPILLLALLALLPLRAHDAAAAQTPEVLRLHILANSDAETDQNVKLRVRDALQPLFEAQESYADARAFVLENGAVLQSTAESVLRENGIDYGVQLSLGTEEFPDRTYDGVLFPAGPYDALIVRLGRGEGHNWWCVLFPPLCIVTETGEPVNLNTVKPESALYNLVKEWIGRWNIGKPGSVG